MATSSRIKAGLSLVVLIFITSIASYAQQTIYSKLSAYKKMLDNNQIEKIHIQTNLPYYKNFDTLWFKAYIINANINLPSEVSHTLTVELFNSTTGKQIRQIKAKISFGIADGYLNLSDTLMEGNYLLRAYTDKMESYGPTYYYEKLIRIVNGQKIEHNKSLNKMDITFFPEGGELVEGLKSSVGFKTIGLNGLGVELKADLIDDLETVVTSIATSNLGMGKFELIPQPNRKYYVNVLDSNRKLVKYPLPSIKKTGYVMSVTSTKDSITIKFNGTPDLPTSELIVLASQDGVTRYLKVINQDHFKNGLILPKDLFYTGIIQFTLFDDNEIPIAERLIFCNHKDFLNIKANVKSNYIKQEKVNVSIDVKNQEGNNQVASLSMSVYNESIYSLQEEEESTIYSDLLLTSDLKGYIEKPNSYFIENNINADANIDILLLTQGWRKFSWKNKLVSKLPEIIKKQKNINVISGKVYHSSGKPFKNGSLNLFQNGINGNVYESKTDSLGNFVFKGINITDTASFILSSNTLSNKKKIIFFVDGLHDENIKTIKDFQLLKLPEIAENSSQDNLDLDKLFLKSNGINLSSVNIVAKKTVIKESANINGAGKADVIILGKDLESTQDLRTYLTNRVPGLKIFKGMIYSREIPDPGQKIPPPPPPMSILMDGVLMDQQTFSIGAISPDDVESIEVMKGASVGMFGIEGAGGVLVISLKRGNDLRSDHGRYSNGVFAFTLSGYQKVREFYEPKFKINTPQQKDLRRALYWNTNIISTADKKLEIAFSNSDYTGRFKIVIEAMNAEGQIGRTISYYYVK